MNLKSLFTASFLVISSLTSITHAETPAVGVMNFTFDATHRDRLVQSLVFYPASKGGYPEFLGDNAVFKGVRVQRDARPEQTSHPLVIVSHGSGGNAANLAWLAHALTEQGFVVVIPNHQGSTSADSTPETTIPAVWQRPADMSRLLDAIAASPSMGKLVDMSDVTALGFSLGGLTVLSLAGVQMEADKLAAFCDANPDNPMGCAWFAKGNALIPGNVDLHKIDKSRFNAAYPDTRIKRVIAIDPSFPVAFNQLSLKSAGVPVQFINLGNQDTIPEGVRADQVALAMPDARHVRVADANHFDFLAECKSFGWFYIWMEGDDPVCTKTSNNSRAELHDDITQKIMEFLNPSHKQDQASR